ncbi:hypothetical protein SAMN05421780_101605 [Flexibacter flexilis DSM 6793]|uniref:Uncharacterized protein n=1 Tax=Flexibacter flexilis DSM 6793 TaxID=927664 RepID=A0A1I1E9K0_9BACT|nr:hypothetical protein SAMN05421780_101605 [Flexibacter flexilis DSM 6793]
MRLYVKKDNLINIVIIKIHKTVRMYRNAKTRHVWQVLTLFFTNSKNYTVPSIQTTRLTHNI